MKKDQKITVREYVHTAQGVVPVEELTPEQKETLRRWIICTWVNTLYAGRAEVFFPEDEKGGCGHPPLREVMG